MSGTLEAIMKKFIALCKVYQKLSLLNCLQSNNDVGIEYEHSVNSV